MTATERDRTSTMTTPPPSARESADLTDRLHPLTGRSADEAERVALPADQPPMTAESAARALAGPGRTLEDSRALVRQYLDEVSQQLGVPVHRWGLDEEDLRAIESGTIAAAHPEQARREQLTAWHADDRGHGVEDDLVRER